MTTFVYPGEAQQFIRQHYWDVPEFHYENYYETPRAWYVATVMDMDLSQLRLWQKMW